MNLLSPKARLVRGDDPGRSWVVLRKARRPRKRGFHLRNAVALLLAVAILTFGLYTAWQRTAQHVTDTSPPTSVAAAALLPEAIPSQPDPTTEPSSSTETASPPTAGNLPFLKNNPRIRIGKIGVDMPIVEGQSENVLFRGAWRSPWSSTPEAGGNTVLFGHRYLHLPPHPETFYSLDKIAVGDTFEVFWNGKTRTYRISETFIVPPTDVSVLKQTDRPVVTLITCTPIFTTKNRLIVRGELIEA